MVATLDTVRLALWRWTSRASNVVAPKKTQLVFLSADSLTDSPPWSPWSQTSLDPSRDTLCSFGRFVGGYLFDSSLSSTAVCLHCKFHRCLYSCWPTGFSMRIGEQPKLPYRLDISNRFLLQFKWDWCSEHLREKNVFNIFNSQQPQVVHKGPQELEWYSHTASYHLVRLGKCLDAGWRRWVHRRTRSAMSKLICDWNSFQNRSGSSCCILCSFSFSTSGDSQRPLRAVAYVNEIVQLHLVSWCCWTKNRTSEVLLVCEEIVQPRRAAATTLNKANWKNN